MTGQIIMVNPVPGYSVSTAYRKTGENWTTCGWHTGQDYAAPLGTPIVAARSGIVAWTSYGSSFGPNQFAVRPGDGTEDFYGHTMSRPSSGSQVNMGEEIATVGNLGNTTGPHLHFERHKSLGWGCSLMDDPMKSHNAGQSSGGGTSDETEEDDFWKELLMANVIVFYQDGNGIWEANLLSGTRHVIANPEDLEDRKHVLTKSGVPWGNWTAGDVANSEAFGLKVVQ